MAHAESNSGRTIGIRTQGFLVKGKSTTEVLFIESNASLAEQRRDVGRRLIEHEIELDIGLFHFVTLEQAEVGTTQQMVLEEDSFHNL